MEKVSQVSLEQVCDTIRVLLDDAVGKNLGEGILFSGGLDTSIIATIASKYARPAAFTIGLSESPAPDLDYARLLAKQLGLPHTVHIFDHGELRETLTHVVRVLKTFDPMEVRNSATIAVGLKLAKEAGIGSVMTGDAADELFAGYSFLFQLSGKELRDYLQRMWMVMRFSSVPLANSLGMQAKLPYLHPPFKEYAMKLDLQFLTQRQGDTTYGKWILRKAFEDQLPREIAWRTKTAIEFGSGTTILPKLFGEWIGDDEFREKKAHYLEIDGVNIRDKEHLAYYEIYRRMHGPPQPEDTTARTCPQCNSNVPEMTNFCTTCGAYPI